MSKLLIFTATATICGSAMAANLVADPYPPEFIQPTHCTADFEIPNGADSVTDVVQDLPDGSVRCAINLSGMTAPGEYLSIRVRLTATSDQLPDVDSDPSDWTDLEVPGKLATPTGLRIEP